MRTDELVVSTLLGPPGPDCSHSIDTDILWPDVDVDFLRLGEHGNCRRRGVDTTARLGLRNALNAVHAGFELEAAQTRPRP